MNAWLCVALAKQLCRETPSTIDYNSRDIDFVLRVFDQNGREVAYNWPMNQVVWLYYQYNA